MIEIWKDIIGYENLYQVSNLGNIKSHGIIVKIGNSSYKKKEKILQPSGERYYKVVLTNFNKESKNYLVHRLVGIHFIDNIENKPCINHIDGNKKNNYYMNLEWCNHSENVIHAYKTGLAKNTEKQRMIAKLNTGIKSSQSVPILNIETNEIYCSLRDAAKILGLKEYSISHHLNKYGKYKNLIYAKDKDIK